MKRITIGRIHNLLAENKDRLWKEQLTGRLTNAALIDRQEKGKKTCD